MNEGKTELHTFPKTKEEALTMLYLSQQNLENCDPETLVRKYLDALQRIKFEFPKARGL